MSRTHSSVRIEATDGVAANYFGARKTSWGASLLPSVHVELSHDLTVWSEPELVVAKLTEALVAALEAIAEGQGIELGGAA